MPHAGAGGRALLRVEIELGGSFACDGRGRVWRVERGSDAARPLYAKGRAMRAAPSSSTMCSWTTRRIAAGAVMVESILSWQKENLTTEGNGRPRLGLLLTCQWVLAFAHDAVTRSTKSFTTLT